jgi:hypothetical protein
VEFAEETCRACFWTNKNDREKYFVFSERLPDEDK